MTDPDKLPWMKVLVAIISIGTPLLMYFWSVEKRMAKFEASQNVTERVAHLEDVLLPVLVEYNLQLELKKLHPQPPALPESQISNLRRRSENIAKESLIPPSPSKGG